MKFTRRKLLGSAATMIGLGILTACAGGTTTSPSPTTAAAGATATKPAGATPAAGTTPGMTPSAGATAAATPAAGATPSAAAAMTPTAAAGMTPTTAAGTTPTAASSTGGTSMKVTGKFSLWHGWTGVEEETLTSVINNLKQANPGLTIDVLAVPFDQLKNKYTTEASTGGGPDVLISPKDWIGEFAQAKLIMPLDDIGKDILAQLNPNAVTANKFQGKVWAFPESTEAVALWYNTSKVKTAPTNTDDLLKIAQDAGLALNIGFYQAVGLLAAFGGKIFDDQMKCILDQGSGTVDFLNYMKQAKSTPNVIADADGGKLDAAFKDGKVGMIFNGPWATGDYVKAIGKDKLAIAKPITIVKTGKTFAPFLGTKNFMINANSKGDAQKSALAFVNYIISPDVQQQFALKAGHIPANQSVKVDDPIISGFVAQTQSTTYFPNEPEMGAVWTPAGDMITKVLDGSTPPEQAAQQATQTINNANKKA